MDLAAEGSPGELEINRTVYHAENIGGHRNRALAWLLRSFEIIDSDPEPVVQDYFLECSTDVTTENLSMMAATLANKGVNPITGKEVFSEETTRQVLRSEEHTSELQSRGHLVCRLLLEKKKHITSKY